MANIGRAIEDIVEKKPEVLVGVGCCCGIPSFILFIMFLCSFKGLHATKFALTRNTASGTVNFENVHQGGRNFIGFWNDYLEFPATIQTIQWLEGAANDGSKDLSPLQARTQDGLMVKLGLVVTYLINKEHLPDICQRFKMDVESFFVSKIRSAIQQEVSNFLTTDLYEHRLTVASKLTKMCQFVASEELDDYVSCWRIDLLDVYFDDKIEAANIREQVEKEKQRTEAMRQNASLVRAHTEVLVAEYMKNKSIVEATAQAKAYRVTQKAISDAELETQAARAGALKKAQDTLTSGSIKLTNAQLLTYFEKLALIEGTDGPMVYGNFQTSNVFFKQM